MSPILPENDFGIIVNEMVIFLNNVASESKRWEILNYFNDHDIISQEQVLEKSNFLKIFRFSSKTFETFLKKWKGRPAISIYILYNLF